VVQHPDHPFFYPCWERLEKLSISNKQASKETIWLVTNKRKVLSVEEKNKVMREIEKGKKRLT
jgi:hypothetical protein